MGKRVFEALQNLFLTKKELIYVTSYPESARKEIYSTSTYYQVNSLESLQNFFLTEEELMSIEKFWQTSGKP